MVFYNGLQFKRLSTQLKKNPEMLHYITIGFSIPFCLQLGHHFVSVLESVVALSDNIQLGMK